MECDLMGGEKRNSEKKMSFSPESQSCSKKNRVKKEDELDTDSV